MLLNKYITSDIIKRYRDHHFRNDNVLINLDNIDFAAFIWQIWTCRFDVTGFSNKGFLHYILTRTENCIEIINNIMPQRDRIEKLFLN